MTTGRLKLVAYDWQMRSAADFVTSYGCLACRGISSRYGRSSWAPYALSDDAVTIWRMDGLRRHASSRLQVPRILVSKVDTGFLLAMPTMVWAARWNAVSTSYSPRILSSSGWSRTSPRTTRTCRSRPARTNSLFGSQSLTRHTTSASFSSRLRTSQPPRNPVAPVTKVGRSRQKVSPVTRFSRAPDRSPTCR